MLLFNLPNRVPLNTYTSGCEHWALSDCMYCMWSVWYFTTAIDVFTSSKISLSRINEVVHYVYHSSRVNSIIRMSWLFWLLIPVLLLYMILQHRSNKGCVLRVLILDTKLIILQRWENLWREWRVYKAMISGRCIMPLRMIQGEHPKPKVIATT